MANGDGGAISLINEAIDASIKFEVLMEKIDFDSWFEEKDNKDLTSEFDKQAYDKYKEWVKEVKGLCEGFINPDYEKCSTDANEVNFVESSTHSLFKAKLCRLEARRASDPTNEEKKYIEGSNILNIALSRIPLRYLQEQEEGTKKEYYDLLKILFYNDLSICYSGLKNSSLSRGYAEESIKLIELDKDYKEFKNGDKDLLKRPFKKSKKFDLYTFALFCKGVAEYRSSLIEESEKTFNKIIALVDDNEELINSDYFSTLLKLAVLLIDLGRGREAIEVINKFEKSMGEDDEEKMDRRWAEVLLEKASALIDQSRYTEARTTLNRLLDSEISREEKRVAEPMLNGLIYYGRSYLEDARNILKGKEKQTERAEKLENAITILNDAYFRCKKRPQKQLIQKATKYLAEAYIEDENTEETINYFSIAISFGEVENFIDLLKSEKRNSYIEQCEDTILLDNFAEQISEFKSSHSENDKKLSKEYDNINDCLIRLLNKLKKECDEKGRPVLSERAEQRIEELGLPQDDPSSYIPETLEKKKEFIKNYKVLIGEKHKNNDVLTADQIQAHLVSNEKLFDKALFGRTDDDENGTSRIELIVLKRWNSFSPSLSRRYAVSLGGGYLLRIHRGGSNGKKWFNIVIDPGYSYLLNFHNENFKIQDIDAIVVTHSHPDHCAELSGIMGLIYQYNKRKRDGGEKKRVYLLLSEGTYKKFSTHLQDWKQQLKDIVLLKGETKWHWPENNKEFELEAIQTAHADLGGVRAVGLIFKIESMRNFLIGFTGDTSWRKHIKDSFKKCDLLCLHIGTVKSEEIGFNGNVRIDEKNLHKEVKKKVKDASHLLFYGSRDLINKCEKDDALVIVGEFGEELKYKLRADLVKKLRYDNDNVCVPADIGLYVRINDEKVTEIKCAFCEEFVPQDKIKVFPFGIMDSLHYICDACNCTLSESQKGTIVEYRLTQH